MKTFKTAHAIIERGDPIVMYAEAGRSRSKKLGKPRHGLGRLALRDRQRRSSPPRSPAPSMPAAGSGSSSRR